MALKTTRVEVGAEARRALRSLPRNEQREVAAVLRDLRSDPIPPDALELRGARGLYRLRVGGYRIVYRVAKDGPRDRAEVTGTIGCL